MARLDVIEKFYHLTIPTNFALVISHCPHKRALGSTAFVSTEGFFEYVSINSKLISNEFHLASILIRNAKSIEDRRGETFFEGHLTKNHILGNCRKPNKFMTH